VVKCIAQAVNEYKEVQAMKKGKKLIVFDDVDVGLVIERHVASERFATAYCVRKANEKSFRPIHDVGRMGFLGCHLETKQHEPTIGEFRHDGIKL
jgi:hypothetical protein